MPATNVTFNLARDYSGQNFFNGWDFYGSWDNLTLSRLLLCKNVVEWDCC